MTNDEKKTELDFHKSNIALLRQQAEIRIRRYASRPRQVGGILHKVLEQIERAHHEKTT